LQYFPFSDAAAAAVAAAATVKLQKDVSVVGQVVSGPFGNWTRMRSESEEADDF
jgi:hypothetical protein